MLIELHNKPNLIIEEWLLSLSDFSAWFTDVATLIHAQWPSLLLGYPGLSPKPEVNAWLDDLLSNGNLLNRVHWIGIHAYWAHESLMFEPEHGGYYKRYIERFSNHELLITEFSHKNAIQQGEKSKGDQYVDHYRVIPPQIIAAYSYISVDANFPNVQRWGTAIAEDVVVDP